MQGVGRGLQLIGLVLVGMGLIHGLSGEGMSAMNLELGLAGGGVAVFVLGWWLQKGRA